MRTYTSAFKEILEIIAKAPQYTIGDFLNELFGSPPHQGHAMGRLVRHGKMLAAFIKGTSTYRVGEVLQALHQAAEEFGQTEEEPLYMLTQPYKEMKSGSAALTSYAAQEVCHRLLEEQKVATNTYAGLHVFEPHKSGEEVKMRLSWDTYGATTLADVQAILEQHQRLTFDYISLLAHPGRHKQTDEFRYRPPNIVCDTSML